MSTSTAHRATVVTDPADGRRILSSLPRGRGRDVILCGACGTWLSLGQVSRHEPRLDGVLVRCRACRAINDPHRTVPAPEGGEGPVGEVEPDRNGPSPWDGLAGINAATLARVPTERP